MSDLESDLDARLALHRNRFALDLAIRIPAQGITAVLGPSGGGKTTLLRLLAGLERPNQGHIRHGRHRWLDTAAGINVPTRQRRVGFMFQHYALFPHLSVARNIAFGLPRGSNGRALVAAWLERIGLSRLADQRPSALSGGERQRVALARALAPQPTALFLDEPFSAVDASLRQTLRLLLHELVAEAQVPTLLVSHDIDDVRQIADHAAVIIDGELRRFGTTAEVFADPGDAEVARILGWHNLLPVVRWDGRAAVGNWGALDIESPAATAGPGMLAIRPNGPRFNCGNDTGNDTGKGLPVEIKRVVEMDGYRALFCQLNDRSRLRIHLGEREVPPALGRAQLSIPPECIRLLPSGHAP